MTPWTKAGKALLDDLHGAYRRRSGYPGLLTKRIAAIEEEAVSEYREALWELVAAVDEERRGWRLGGPGHSKETHIAREKARSLLGSEQVKG